MQELPKTWNIVHAGTPGCKSYKGTFDVTPKNKVLTGAWKIQHENGHIEHYSGIGLSINDYMIFSRTKEKVGETGNNISASIVHYVPIGQTGSLSALWIEPNIYYNVGSGIALGGKAGVLEGNYRVTYFDPGGINPVELDIQIFLSGKERNIYRLEWYRDGEHRLTGTGIEIQGELAVAYDRPGTESQMVVYSIHRENARSFLNGHYASTESDVPGTELLLPVNKDNLF